MRDHLPIHMEKSPDAIAAVSGCGCEIRRSEIAEAVLAAIALLTMAGVYYAFNFRLREKRICFTNYPPAWKMEYHARKWRRDDPVYLYCLHASDPLSWKEIRLQGCSAFAAGKGNAIFAAARKFGLVSGYVIPLQLISGFLSIASGMEDENFTVFIEAAYPLLTKELRAVQKRLCLMEHERTVH